jgi:hypothetical protein
METVDNIDNQGLISNMHKKKKNQIYTSHIPFLSAHLLAHNPPALFPSVHNHPTGLPFITL